MGTLEFYFIRKVVSPHDILQHFFPQIWWGSFPPILLVGRDCISGSGFPCRPPLLSNHVMSAQQEQSIWKADPHSFQFGSGCLLGPLDSSQLMLFFWLQTL